MLPADREGRAEQRLDRNDTYKLLERVLLHYRTNLTFTAYDRTINLLVKVKGLGKVKSTSSQVVQTAGAYPDFRIAERKTEYLYSPLEGTL